MENKKPCVFVIEDEESISKLVCMYLEKSDILPEPFYNAEDALKKLSDGTKPDLLILDLNLPGMSGFEFLQQFREMFKASIPVMIVSARDADEDIIKGLNIGADEFVTKPFELITTSCTFFLHPLLVRRFSHIILMNIILSTIFALIKMSICHPWVFVKF